MVAATPDGTMAKAAASIPKEQIPDVWWEGVSIQALLWKIWPSSSAFETYK